MILANTPELRSFLRSAVLKRDFAKGAFKFAKEAFRRDTALSFDTCDSVEDGKRQYANVLRYGRDWGSPMSDEDGQILATEADRSGLYLSNNVFTAGSLFRLFGQDKTVLGVLLRHGVVTGNVQLMQACFAALPVTYGDSAAV